MQVYELGWSAFFPVRRTRGTDRASSARTSCRSDNSVPANQEIGEQHEAGSVRTGSGWPEADGRRAGAVAARGGHGTLRPGGWWGRQIGCPVGLFAGQGRGGVRGEVGG